MERHIPERIRDGFIFHATELFNGGKTLRREKIELIGPHEWPVERRLEIAEEIMDIPRKFKLPVVIGFIDRAQFPISFALPEGMSEVETIIAAHVSAFMSCAMMAEHWVRKEASNENCLLIVENNDRARNVIRDVQRYHQERKLEAVLDEVGRQHFPFRKIKEDPLFQPKRASNPLVIADFCAYVFKRFLMGDARYNRFFNQIKPHLVSFDEGWLERRRGRDLRRAHQ